MTSDRGSVLADIRGRTPGDHICWMYTNEEEHAAVLTAYFREGLDAGQKLVYLESPETKGKLETYLADAGVDSAPLISSGRLSVRQADETYTPGGRFDPGSLLAGFRQDVVTAVSEGYSALRIAGETAWLVDDPVSRSLWPAYEFRADVLINSLPIVGLCCYDTRLTSRQSLGTVSSVHTLCLGQEPEELGTMFHMHATRAGSLRVEGEIDLTCSPDVRGLLIAGWPEAGNTLDLSGLEFVDIPGIKAIAEAVQVKCQGGETVELKGTSPTFRKVWELLSLSCSKEVSLT